MKRAGIATGITVALLVTGFGGRADAVERRRTQTEQYRGHSSELGCRTRELQDVWNTTCGAAETAHNAVLSDRTRFVVPSWARSVRVSITDDNGRPVGFRVYFDNDRPQNYRFANSTCAQVATLNLKPGTKRTSVARVLGGCAGAHTTGVVTATFSSEPTTRPSPRFYVSGCSILAVSGTGFGGGGCTYTASKAGGYFAAGIWQIRILRGNVTIERSAVDMDPHCSPTGFIRAGDRVTIGQLVGYTAAGDDVHC